MSTAPRRRSPASLIALIVAIGVLIVLAIMVTRQYQQQATANEAAFSAAMERAKAATNIQAMCVEIYGLPTDRCKDYAQRVIDANYEPAVQCGISIESLTAANFASRMRTLADCFSEKGLPPPQ